VSLVNHSIKLSLFFWLDYINAIMFLKTLLHPHKNYIAGNEWVILGELSLLVAIFLEVGRGHVNSIPSQVLSKKFTCMCESATLFLWNTVWLTFLRCLFITKLVMEYIWVTHRVNCWKIGMISGLYLHNSSNIYLELFLQIKLFQSLSKAFSNSEVWANKFSSTTSVYT